MDKAKGGSKGGGIRDGSGGGGSDVEDLHGQGKNIRYILCLRRELGGARRGRSTLVFWYIRGGELFHVKPKGQYHWFWTS